MFSEVWQVDPMVVELHPLTEPVKPRKMLFPAGAMEQLAPPPPPGVGVGVGTGFEPDPITTVELICFDPYWLAMVIVTPNVPLLV